MMRAKFQVEKPKDIVFTLTLSMSLSEWEELQNQLSDGYPAWQLSRAITDVICQAKQTFHTNTSEESPTP